MLAGGIRGILFPRNKPYLLHQRGTRWVPFNFRWKMRLCSLSPRGFENKSLIERDTCSFGSILKIYILAAQKRVTFDKRNEVQPTLASCVDGSFNEIGVTKGVTIVSTNYRAQKRTQQLLRIIFDSNFLSHLDCWIIIDCRLWIFSEKFAVSRNVWLVDSRM